MNFSHYKGLVEGDKIRRFIFAQGNRPAAELTDGQVKYLSEAFLFQEDMQAINTEIVKSIEQGEQQNFYLDGRKYTFKALFLSDASQIIVYPCDEDELSWQDIQVPGYVNDWVAAQSGILIFYGSDFEFVEKVRIAFSKMRLDSIKGANVVFSSKTLNDIVSREGSFVLSSTDEQGFLSSKSNMGFETYSLMGDLTSLDSNQLLRMADQTSLVILNSYWSDLEKVWAEISRSITDESFRDLFLQSLIGFVGVKKVASKNTKDQVVFEALPMMPASDFQGLPFETQIENLKGSLRKQGVSFNQSIHSLILKRQISLDSAYQISSNPEELNRFLSDSGV